MTRTVLLLADVELDDVRQERVALRYADAHGLDVVSFARRDPAAAVAVVRLGAAAVVLMPLEPRGLTELESDVHAVGGRMAFARAASRRVVAEDATVVLIRTALANSGGDVALVAQLLGLAVDKVAAVGGLAGAPERRAQRLAGLPTTTQREVRARRLTG